MREVRVAGYGWMPVREAAQLVAAHDAADEAECAARKRPLACRGPWRHGATVTLPNGNTVVFHGNPDAA